VKRLNNGLATLVFSLLAACGGGGGTNSTPAPPVQNPTPSTNSLITDLKVNQTFIGDATTTQMTVETSSGIVKTSSGNRATISVRYNAADNSYAIETGSVSRTFGPADAQATTTEGERKFRKAGPSSDNLTLVTTPYYGNGTSNKYVGMGYFQSNTVSSGTQSTIFSTFAYGIETPSISIPKTGTARWDTDIFGLLTTPGIEIRTIQGRGRFDVDFATSQFSTFSNVDEFDFITGGGRVGSLRFQAAGQLGSAGSFTGNFSYNGSANVAGTLAGRFYGPEAEEIGATFDARDETTVLTGAMTGQRSADAPQANFTLLNVSQEQQLPAYAASLFTQTRQGTPGFVDIKTSSDGALATITPSGPGPIGAQAESYSPAAGDLVSEGPSNFITYQSQANGQPLEVQFYKPGNANTELALTYTSFATWSGKKQDVAPDGTVITNELTHHIIYGFETPRDLLAARTGSATYQGVVYGHGGSLAGDAYSVGGTSRFDVDFSASRYSGTLELTGTHANGAGVNFGKFGFGNTMNYGQMRLASFDNGANADPFHGIQPYFFGPDGQEIGATFRLATGAANDPGTVQISGITVAKRQ
jgi:hypothetical protein